MATLRPPDFQLFSLKNDPDGLWVAEADGEIVGFALSWVCGELWFLAELFVAPGQLMPLAELVMLPLSLTTEGIVCCHSGATLNLYRVMSCAFWGRNMRQAPVYWAVDPACSRVGRAAQTASTFLGGLCLFFGPAFATSVPASLEARIVYLCFFGLIPALGFYVSGHILRQMCWCSVAGSVRSIAARCARRPAPFANGLANWAGAFVLDVLDRCLMIIARCLLTAGQWMQRLFRLGQKAYSSVHCRYWHVHKAIFEFSCLLIRNTARFVIRMQRPTERNLSREFRDSSLSLRKPFYVRNVRIGLVSRFRTF